MIDKISLSCACYMHSHHDLMLIAAVIRLAAAKGTRLLLPRGGRFSAQCFWQDACTHGMTSVVLVPAMIKLLLADAGANSPRKGRIPLRSFWSIGAKLPSVMHQQVQDVFGIPIYEVPPAHYLHIRVALIACMLVVSCINTCAKIGACRSEPQMQHWQQQCMVLLRSHACMLHSKGSRSAQEMLGNVLQLASLPMQISTATAFLCKIEMF